MKIKKVRGKEVWSLGSFHFSSKEDAELEALRIANPELYNLVKQRIFAYSPTGKKEDLLMVILKRLIKAAKIVMQQNVKILNDKLGARYGLVSGVKDKYYIITSDKNSGSYYACNCFDYGKIRILDQMTCKHCMAFDLKLQLDEGDEGSEPSPGATQYIAAKEAWDIFEWIHFFKKYLRNRLKEEFLTYFGECSSNEFTNEIKSLSPGKIYDIFVKAGIDEYIQESSLLKEIIQEWKEEIKNGEIFK